MSLSSFSACCHMLPLRSYHGSVWRAARWLFPLVGLTRPSVPPLGHDSKRTQRTIDSTRNSTDTFRTKSIIGRKSPVVQGDAVFFCFDCHAAPFLVRAFQNGIIPLPPLNNSYERILLIGKCWSETKAESADSKTGNIRTRKVFFPLPLAICNSHSAPDGYSASSRSQWHSSASRHWVRRIVFVLRCWDEVHCTFSQKRKSNMPQKLSAIFWSSTPVGQGCVSDILKHLYRGDPPEHEVKRMTAELANTGGHVTWVSQCQFIAFRRLASGKKGRKQIFSRTELQLH